MTENDISVSFAVKPQLQFKKYWLNVNQMGKDVIIFVAICLFIHAGK